ncbi:MAG: NeuD/PglB/VioB family sugar acetyltransferase [Dongiaceae bacterium]
MTDEPIPPVLILGAGRQGRNVAHVLRDAGRPVMGFLDDTKARGARVDGVEVLGGFDRAYDAALLRAAALLVAIGKPATRQRLTEELAARGARLASAIHPSATMSAYAQLGPGLFVGAFVRLAPGVRIGVGCLIEASCSIGCDCELAPFATLAPHCSLTAGSRIGAGSFVGTHGSVGGVSVGNACIVGAGSVVVRDLPDGVRAFGAPAKIVGPADWSRPPV